MNVSELLLQLIPESWRPYAKAVVASVPALAYALVTLMDVMSETGYVVPGWLALLVAFLTSVGVYEVRNVSRWADEPEDDDS